MQIAQGLYEGVNIGSSRVGLITYMRTDSTRLSAQSIQDVRDFLQKNYPGEMPEKPNYFASSKSAQDAHEAIRPTYASYSPDYVKKHLTRDQFRLYSIIWERFVACQMKNARMKTETVDFAIGDAVFRASATKAVEPGFQKVLKVLKSREKRTVLPSLSEGELIEVEGFIPEQHFTSGPARYSDASIIKTLEERGIGRPSTYAPIISRLLDRYYVVRKNRQLVPTTPGKIINDMLVETFPDIIEVGFTAEMEQRLDLVEENKQEWHEMIGEFYDPFRKKVDHVMETLESIKCARNAAVRW
jgi:DNA topoisomerase-1